MTDDKKEVIDQVASVQTSVNELVKESRTNPSNSDLLDTFVKHAGEDAKFQTDTTEIHKTMNARMDTLATKDDVRSIFAQELRSFFKVTGLNTKTFIITAATIVGALVVLGGGIKTVLGWLGFTLMK